MIAALPEPGQLVEVRQRRFVVQEVRPSALPLPILQQAAQSRQHLISLSSVEDDALGEVLEVIWELEPGARAFERMALPEPCGFDEPRRLDAFLDAVRWGAVSSADTRALQSPFRSGIDIEDYQLDPVVRALQMPRVNLLIADDVGLGKTIEAGLVAQELILRHRVRSILIVCPSSLQIQWREQMRDKFGLEFRIVDSALMKDLRRRRGLHTNPWTHFPRLITSIDFLKRERSMRLFRETLPAEGDAAFPRRFDLMIVDEAHNIAPPGTGRYATDSMRTQAIRTLAPHFEHKLFLTATPHNGYPESFTAFLELLDNQRFARGVRPNREQLGAIMIRRMKQELPPRWDGSPRFPKRSLEPLEVAYPEWERDAHQAMTDYTKLRIKGAVDPIERCATEFVMKLLKKRLFSSPAAFESTLAKHEASLKQAHRRQAGMVKPTMGILKRQIDGIDEDFADDATYDDLTIEVVETASRLFRDLSPQEEALMKTMRAYAERASGQADAKAETFLKWLHETVRPNRKWGNDRVIIFTEYRATQKWLQGLIAAEGLAESDRLMTLYGGMKAEDRERVKAAFQASPDVSPVRILLATDAASEGLDLQNHCSRLIHFEIPWNPNRMEQRNGRIDRHGQKATDVRIFHFVGAGYRDRASGSEALKPGELEGDLEFLMRAALKVESIREDLGKVGPVIASQVEEAMLGFRSSLDTNLAEREAEPVRRMLKFERKLQDQIEKLRQQLQETKNELHLSPENIQAVVEVALALAGQPPLREAKGSWPAFHLPPLSGSWALCMEGLAHPHTGQIRPIVFDHAIADGRDDVILAHLNHRLVQMCLRLLRAEIWSTQDRKALHRVTARVVPGDAIDTPAVVAHGRLVVLGGDHQRLHEEIIAAGGWLREGRFNRMNVGEVKAALDAASQQGAPQAIKQKLTDLWSSHENSLRQALEARMNDRTTGLGKLLAERASKETTDMHAILKELERSIREQLKEPEFLQLSLFEDIEREQYHRDKANLHARLGKIPEELERETRAILARYTDPQPRLFPVAITYLIPEKLVKV